MVLAGSGFRSVIMKFHDMTGAIICGGSSRRFGSDKRLFQYQGKTFLETSFQKLDQICHQTVCVFRAPPPVELNHYPQIFDAPHSQGPMAGVLAALQFSKTPFVFVLPCDVLKIPVSFLKYFSGLRNFSKIVVLYTHHLEPLIGLYPSHFYGALKSFSDKGDFSLKSFLCELSILQTDFVKLHDLDHSMPMVDDFENFNRPPN